jgi:hypothetical protein
MDCSLMKTFTLALVMSSAAVYAQDTTDLGTTLESVNADHPRLFFRADETDALRTKISGDPLLQGVVQRIVASCDEVIDLEPVKREKVGRRLLGVSRLCLQRVTYLAMAYRLTDDERYLNRCEREMVAAASFEDWNPSHFLDVAEMTAALAIGYDWLYNDLSPDARVAIREAIVEKGLKTSLEGGWWVTTENNWNQVCHGGLTLGALAVLEDEPELAEQIIARAIKNVPRAMHEYEPDGVYPEGPSYWKYGTTYNVILIAALESVLGNDFGLSDEPGFMRSPEFYLHATGPTGMFYNFSDCGLYGGVSTAMYWFAARLDNPALLYRERIALQEFVEDDGANRPGADRTLPFLLIWAESQGGVIEPDQLHWKGLGRTPITVHRSGWDAQAAYFAIKGGSASTNHAHMDAGSFVYDRDGVRWAVDLGSQSYHSLESRGVSLWGKKQDSERWTVFRLNNLSHNTLVVDGQLHSVDGHATIEAFSDDPGHPYTLIDMSPVYEGQLTSAWRGVKLLGKDVFIQDEIAAGDEKRTVRWGMATQANVSVVSTSEALLTQGGQSLALHVIAPERAAISIIDMENPPRDYDAKNPNTRMVSFEIEVRAAQQETLAVYMTTATNPVTLPKIAPLKTWAAP